MKNEKYYIDQLETSLRLSNKQCIQEEMIDIFEELLTARPFPAGSHNV